jgi:hypothetical protein
MISATWDIWFQDEKKNNRQSERHPATIGTVEDSAGGCRFAYFYEKVMVTVKIK